MRAEIPITGNIIIAHLTSGLFLEMNTYESVTEKLVLTVRKGSAPPSLTARNDC